MKKQQQKDKERKKERKKETSKITERRLFCNGGNKWKDKLVQFLWNNRLIFFQSNTMPLSISLRKQETTPTNLIIKMAGNEICFQRGHFSWVHLAEIHTSVNNWMEFFFSWNKITNQQWSDS